MNLIGNKKKIVFIRKRTLFLISYLLLFLKFFSIFLNECECTYSDYNPVIGLQERTESSTESSYDSKDKEFKNILTELTCGEKGNHFSKFGKQFVKKKLESFSKDEYNKLKYMNKLPIIYRGENKNLMSRSFKTGEILGAPLRLRTRIEKDQNLIPVIEDDFIILSNKLDFDKQMDIIYSRVLNEIRYTTLLCGGEIISLLPVIRYIKELSDSGIDLANDSVILTEIGRYEKEKAASRRRRAEIETRYLSTLPYSNEIYVGKKINSKGLIVGISDSIDDERNVRSLNNKYLIDDIEDTESAIIGMNIRSKEEYFQKNRENMLRNTQPHNIYNSVFDFNSPQALFTSYESQISPIDDNKSFPRYRNVIPHQITRADSISSIVLDRVKSDIKFRDLVKNEYSVDGSVEGEILDTDLLKKNNKNLSFNEDPYNPDSVIIGKNLRPNDQIYTGSSEQIEIIVPDSKINVPEIEPIKGFKLNENPPKHIYEIMAQLERDDFVKLLKNIEVSSKEFKEAFKRFPAYLSQIKIISISDQAYIFWQSIKYSNEVMQEKYGVNVANFPVNEVPSFDLLPKKIPRTNSEITKCCYRIIRFFQKSGTPFIFKSTKKLNENKNYKISYFDPFKAKSLQKYKEYAKILCNTVLPNIFIFIVQYIFQKIVSLRENKFFNQIEERRQEIEVQEKELNLLKNIKKSVVERANITPYLIEKPFERYINAWRRSIGYSGIIVYPSVNVSMFEKIYHIVKFGPEVIKKKKKDASSDEIRSSVSKAIVKLIDEYFSSLNATDFFLNTHEIENFVNKIFSDIFHISIEECIKNMPIKPEISIRNIGYHLNIKDIHLSCIEYIEPIIKVNKNIKAISNNELIENSKKVDSKNKLEKKTVNLEEIQLIESEYETVCLAISNLLRMNIAQYSLSLDTSDGIFSKRNEYIKNTFLHQTLTDGLNTIPVELGLKMFETTYLDVFERICEQHGILKFIPVDLKNYSKLFPMFDEMSKLRPVELTSETVNFSEMEKIFLIVYKNIIRRTDGNNRMEFFNENIMAKYVLENLIQQGLTVPYEIKTVPPFPITHKYPWSSNFLPGLKKWCSLMVYSLAEENLIKGTTDNYIYKKDNIEPVAAATCKEELLLGIQNNIEYEADEILRKNFACHLATAFIYWYYKRPIPKWTFFDQWQTKYDSEPKITLSEEPEISMATFVILKCIADMEYSLPTKIANVMEIKKVLTNMKNHFNENKRETRFSIWNNIPLKSVSNGNAGLSYFLFPNVVERDIIVELSSEDALAFTGPHEIIWVGADKTEFLPMCMNSIQKLYEYIFSKKNSKLNLDIWISEDQNARDLICRDVAGRFFYPKTTLNCDQALSKEGELLTRNFSLERAKLRRSQWLAIQEILRRRKLNKNEQMQNSEVNEISSFIDGLSYSSFVLDFQESNELEQPGSFVKNCISAFDTAMLFPEGSPYKLKIMNKSDEFIEDICKQAMKIYYTSSVPMGWDEQQTSFNPINTENNYFTSRIAIAQHNAIVEQINEQNEFGEHGIINSDQFNFLDSSLILNIGISDNSSKFIENCIEYLWECIKKKLLYFGNGYDMSNSHVFIEKTCRRASYRYFVSEIPLSYEELVNLVGKKSEISEWYRVRYKTGQWKALVDVFNLIAGQYSGGYISAIGQTFKLPKYMQLADFNTSHKLLTIEEDCMKSISYLIKIHSCASNFAVIFGRVNNFCDYVSQSYKSSKI